MTRLWLAVPLAWLAACSEAAPQEEADRDPTGPPGGIIEIDPSTIPLGEGSGGSSAGGSAGSSGAGTSGTSGSDTGGTESGGGSAGTSGTGGSGGTGPVAGGVGAPCELSSDCNAPMYCRSDSIDYIGHKQCTMACDASATCASEFGDDSFCIGANVCVLGCTSDADCFERTHCNSSGWCERGGPGSGVPYCGGTATPCGLQLTTIACISSRGCTSNTDCTGSPESCILQNTEFDCEQQDGCTWLSSDSCSGVARSCSSFSASSTCESQEGCTWNESCTGIPDPCSEQFVALCEDQPGCVLLQ